MPPVLDKNFAMVAMRHGWFRPSASRHAGGVKKALGAFKPAAPIHTSVLLFRTVAGCPLRSTAILPLGSSLNLGHLAQPSSPNLIRIAFLT